MVIIKILDITSKLIIHCRLLKTFYLHYLLLVVEALYIVGVGSIISIGTKYISRLCSYEYFHFKFKIEF